MVVLTHQTGHWAKLPGIPYPNRVNRGVPKVRFGLVLLFLIGWVASLWGCAGPRPSQPEIDGASLPDAIFPAYLAEVELVTVDEAYRAMLILADGEDTSENFEQRRQKLESRGIAKAEWGLQPENVIDAGSAAYMVCRICNIDGGVNMRLFGRAGLGDRRYALRELVYREMLDDAVDYQYMTGGAFFALFRNADVLMEEKGLYEKSGVDLSDETDRDSRGNLIVPPVHRPTTQPGS
ncbi:MAG: hypothetical protein KF841_03365 [Phycisphaerae bacterium]|nr:hypothetical protein [Phycisphaerae bacterium]